MKTDKDFDLFDTIWSSTVEPAIESYYKKYSQHFYKNRLAVYKAKHCFNVETQTFIHSYMVNDTKNIDRHKIASCILKSVLIAKPLKMSFSKKVSLWYKKIDIDDVCYLINQYIALNAAVVILEGYIKSDEKKELKHQICIPEPFPMGEKDYLKDVCLDLYYTKPQKINTITYANIFFLWEKYSCRKVQCDNLEKELLKHLPGTEEDNVNQIYKIKMESEKS